MNRSAAKQFAGFFFDQHKKRRTSGGLENKRSKLEVLNVIK
jgi:hypothetical protein